VVVIFFYLDFFYQLSSENRTRKNKPICLHLCRKMHWKPSLYYNSDTIFPHWIMFDYLFSCLKSKHFFLFNYVPHLFLLTCVKFHGKRIDNNYILTHICLPLIDCIDKSKNTKFTGLNTFYVGKQV
jgi:hypothetical protein